MGAWSPQRPEEGVVTTESGVMDVSCYMSVGN